MSRASEASVLVFPLAAGAVGFWAGHTYGWIAVVVTGALAVFLVVSHLVWRLR